MEKILRTETEKRDIIQRWRASGQSQKEWSRQEGISFHSLRKWISQYKDQEINTKTTRTEFLEVSIEKHVVSTEKLEIIYPNGVELRLPVRLPLRQLQEYIQLCD